MDRAVINLASCPNILARIYGLLEADIHDAGPKPADRL